MTFIRDIRCTLKPLNRSRTWPPGARCMTRRSAAVSPSSFRGVIFRSDPNVIRDPRATRTVVLQASSFKGARVFESHEHAGAREGKPKDNQCHNNTQILYDIVSSRLSSWISYSYCPVKHTFIITHRLYPPSQTHHAYQSHQPPLYLTHDTITQHTPTTH